jgi:hypothetical protein
VIGYENRMVVVVDALNYYLDVYNILRVRRKEMHADENNI